ncbi:hypothetical protein [Halarcobacter anaerophilus]|uniref:hypothetical protein n=1 Tax=Halarcobacter anaerophilus TaxID=877500 RepID=UPI0005C9B685|nr:hypothetical protein [Halarcobacter anaerophilus]
MIQINNLNILKKKTIFLAPYNDLTQSLYELIKGYCNIIGYIDNFKADTNNNIFTSKENLLEYDYIIIHSPNFWIEILKEFPIKKVLLLKNNTLINIEEYKKSLISYKNTAEVLFYPHNQAHTLDMIPIIEELKKFGIKTIVIKSNLNKKFVDKISTLEKVDIDVVFTDLIDYKIFICFVDWHELGPILVDFSHKRNKSTIGIVEGVTDFKDSDYKLKRNAYGRVKYIFATGENDLKYLKNKKSFVVGIPKMKKQLNEKIYFPPKTLVIINLSFVALNYNDDSIYWLEDIVNTCESLKLNYLISQHPSDKTDLTNFINITDLSIYDAIKIGTIIISRFSTVILESLAYGKPVVYYKPKKETNTLFNNNFNSFSIANNKKELKKAILYELSQKDTIREKSNLFLHKQCNINSKDNSSYLAAKYIKKILESNN